MWFIITQLMLSVGVWDTVYTYVFECRLVCRNELLIHSHSHVPVYITVPTVHSVHS